MDKKYDVLIIGCGVAGLYTSLSLPENLSVLVLSKQDETVSNSSLAQGGVATVLSLENDSYELHSIALRACHQCISRKQGVTGLSADGTVVIKGIIPPQHSVVGVVAPAIRVLL